MPSRMVTLIGGCADGKKVTVDFYTEEVYVVKPPVDVFVHGEEGSLPYGHAYETVKYVVGRGGNFYPSPQPETDHHKHRYNLATHRVYWHGAWYTYESFQELKREGRLHDV